MTAAAAEPIAEMLHVPTDVLRNHPRVDQGSDDLNSAWPLAGLLIEPLLDVPSIDMARPRQAPDVGARRRQLIMGGCGILAVGLVALAFAARNQVRDLEQEADQLTKQAVAAAPQRVRFKRDALRLEHLKQWESARTDWLDHLRYLVQTAPPRDRLIFDQWSGAIDFRGVRYADGDWSAPMTLRMTLEGEAADRATADAFRAALVRADVYTTRTAGADTAGGGKRLPFGFAFTLESAGGAPPGDRPE